MRTTIKNTINYYTKDLFDSISEIISNKNQEQDIIIPNISNIDFNTKSRFTIMAEERYPVIANEIQAQKHQLGQNLFIKADRINNNNIYFCQMFCDRNSRFKNINYIHLVSCMIGVRSFCSNIKNKEDKHIEIHAPKFGAGKSGGRWSTISDLINDCWQGIPTFIYRNN